MKLENLGIQLVAEVWNQKFGCKYKNTQVEIPMIKE